MVAYKQNRLVYKPQNANGKMYIDVSQGLALLNAQNCEQFSKGDKPLKFVMSVRTTNSGETLRVAKDSWIVRNGCVKTAAAWRRTLRSAGIRRKGQLNTYARHMRVALNSGHQKTWGGQKSGANDCAIIPQDVDASYETGQYTSDGEQVKVWAFAPGIGGSGQGDTNMNLAQNQYAFTQTTAAVPQSGSTDVKDKPICLVGATDGDNLYITGEYVDSRVQEANVEDTDMDETPSVDNDLVMMLAPGEEVADDVLDNINDEGRWRPYSYGTHNTLIDAITSGGNVAGQDTIVEAPLGLMEWTPSSGSAHLVIDFLHAEEM